MVLRDFWRIWMMMAGLWDSNGSCASIFPPPRGGCRPVKGIPFGCDCAATVKGGGGSTAGCRCRKLPHVPFAKALPRFLQVCSRACRDGRPQYSPRRGPGRFSWTVHVLPVQGRATPLSEVGECLHTIHSPNTAPRPTTTILIPISQSHHFIIPHSHNPTIPQSSRIS